MAWPHGWLTPDWPAPSRVRACVTTRTGGQDVAPYGGFNLALHVGDQPSRVQANRKTLQQILGCQPTWLNQVHGVAVVEASAYDCPEADASWTAQAQTACCVMTADCLPVLFCDQAGTRVAAAHAGWRGLLSGVLESTLDALAIPGGQTLVWLGPAIGAQAFEVGAEVRDAFVSQHADAVQAFAPSARAGHFMADLYMLARQRLAAYGVQAVYGGGLCTFHDPRFYSFRRQPVTGRFASLIWLD